MQKQQIDLCFFHCLVNQVDYRSFLNKLWEAMPADDFVELVSGPTVLGDPDLKTQHFVGASRWERISADEVVGYHQLRVPHQKKTPAKKMEVDKSTGGIYNGIKEFRERTDR